MSARRILPRSFGSYCASLPPSLPRARAPGRGKCLTLPLLSIKMQYINEILLKMTQTSSFFKAIFLTYFKVYCKDEDCILFIGQQRKEESGVGGYPGGGWWVEVDGHGLKLTRFRCRVWGRPLGWDISLFLQPCSFRLCSMSFHDVPWKVLDI